MSEENKDFYLYAGGLLPDDFGQTDKDSKSYTPPDLPDEYRIPFFRVKENL